ncbi:MAG: hypothetical protein ABEJ79_08960 [Halolamina sp.]
MNGSFEEETGANGNYVHGPYSWAINADFDDPVYGSTSDFVEGITEYGYDPDYHSAAGESVVLTFANAFQRVDELTPTNVRDEIAEIQFESAYGTVAFDDSGVIQKEMLVYQWQPEAGKQIVRPPQVQQSEPVYPMPDWNER